MDIINFFTKSDVSLVFIIVFSLYLLYKLSSSAFSGLIFASGITTAYYYFKKNKKININFDDINLNIIFDYINKFKKIIFGNRNDLHRFLHKIKKYQ